ncbi:carnosine N-methyltransferase-like [Lineus longissimus]|uniref:carnosine N-methyltransferase-like n=1 Tax=Lineus longissimus TaxID=88925 RepID=UPI002B4E8687
MAENENDESSSDKLEKEHFQRIVNAFRCYRIHAWKSVQDAEKNYRDLPERHKKLIPNFLENLDDIRLSIDHNNEIIKLIVQTTAGIFENADRHPENGKITQAASEFDMDKVRTTLKQVVRDWSTDGEAERIACYKPVIDDIKEKFPCDNCNRTDVKILVPGSGLGRLAFEIARLGYSCQGNEWSLFMLFASNFILNRCHEPDELILYPYVHHWSNNLSHKDQTHAIKFPDINPSELPPGSDFSMAAGDFLEIYTDEDSWDCIATVFFIDTAHNIVAYIEKIYEILQPGGYWINLGPLLYHFADMPNESSIELSYEDVKSVVQKTGFVIEKEEKNIKCSYTQNPASMLKYVYECVYFVARKPV